MRPQLIAGILLVTIGAMRIVRKNEEVLVTPSTSFAAPATTDAGEPD